MPNGEEIDFTREQLKAVKTPIPKDIPVEVRTRENLFSYPTIQKRYELLKSRFEKAIKVS
jgi:hypothetical protein